MLEDGTNPLSEALCVWCCGSGYAESFGRLSTDRPKSFGSPVDSSSGLHQQTTNTTKHDSNSDLPLVRPCLLCGHAPMIE